MKSMVLTFDNDGACQHTLKDSFFDTRFLGKRNVQRMSEILFDDLRQKFYVTFLDISLIDYNNGSSFLLNEHYELCMYDTYELAVEAEIDFINKFRLQGQKIA